MDHITDNLSLISNLRIYGEISDTVSVCILSHCDISLIWLDQELEEDESK